MGLFDFFKRRSRKSAPLTEDNIINDEFFIECMEVFKQKCEEYSITKFGITSMYEHIQPGLVAVQSYMMDDYIQEQYEDDLQQMYFIIMALSLQAGIAIADVINQNNTITQEEMVEVIGDSVVTRADAICANEFGMNEEQVNELFSQIFEAWDECMRPHWRKDVERHVFIANFSAYLVGVTMIMEKRGY